MKCTVHDKKRLCQSQKENIFAVSCHQNMQLLAPPALMEQQEKVEKNTPFKLSPPTENNG
jgi:hypothetical protein